MYLFGSRAREALREVLQARKAWLEAAETAGQPIPTPAYRPGICLPGS